MVEKNNIKEKIRKNVYNNMLQRCYYKRSKDYPRYGGRGIIVCEEWKNGSKYFINWALENGYKDGLTLDRIDVNGNYCPENCRWVSRKEQARNRRSNKYINFNGEQMLMCDVAKIIGVHKSAITHRINDYGNNSYFINRPRYKHIYKHH